MTQILKPTIYFLFFILQFEIASSQVLFEETSEHAVQSIEGGATWFSDDETSTISYNNNGTLEAQRALLYSTETFQSETGFKLTIEYAIGSIENIAEHNFSFGLISDDTELSSYSGYNPFGSDQTVYSIGVNLTANEGENVRGVNFTNGSEKITLHTSGKRQQFLEGEKTKIFMEIGIGGFWSLYINDEYEESGIFSEGFDLTKNYHIAVYGQDYNGGGKLIQSIKLEKQYAPGERAVHKRGTWSNNSTFVKDPEYQLKTVTLTGPRGYNSGATQSPLHYVQHKLLEQLWGGDADENGDSINLIVPPWGDLNNDTPDDDFYMDEILEIKSRGYKVLGYTNSKNLLGVVGEDYDVIVERWKNYCDTNTEV
ncbi:hypothetical protein [Cellulophaga sp. L1A9]|uniref:hypothetical protein n=1 Tax=Cellulophaga sp. L1A9 TaxID=2686362 RepID=UPI00131CC89C|nr:hypothetical protein [Cellulophaga sp. L1A9]